MKQLNLLIITGLSGAGKSSVAGIMEDSGYYCVDNLPPALIPKFVEVCGATEGRIARVAIVVDIRGRVFFGQLKSALETLKTIGCNYGILFLSATEDTLVKRCKETRRRHPLNSEGSVLSDIKKEIEMMEEIRSQADWVVDTSGCALRDLKEKISSLLFKKDSGSTMSVMLTSFGYKKGLPLDVDLLFDVRFLPNPHYEELLKELPGTDPLISNYVLCNEVAQNFMEKLEDMFDLLIPEYSREGKVHLSIGIGCTGGRHRSVAIVEELRQRLEKQKIRLFIRHRDLGQKLEGVPLEG